MAHGNFGIAKVFFNQEMGEAAEGETGRALLEKNCGRCHALAAGALSPLKEAPNLWIVLRSFPQSGWNLNYPKESAQDTKRCRGCVMEDIERIENYLAGD